MQELIYKLTAQIPAVATIPEIVAQLQTAYDAGSAAGFFEVQAVADGLLIEFRRDIPADLECFEEQGRDGLTPQTAREQLAAELEESGEGPAIEATAKALRDPAQLGGFWLGYYE